MPETGAVCVCQTTCGSQCKVSGDKVLSVDGTLSLLSFFLSYLHGVFCHKSRLIALWIWLQVLLPLQLRQGTLKSKMLRKKGKDKDHLARRADERWMEGIGGR